MRSEQKYFWTDKLFGFFRFLWFTVCELKIGVVNERINIRRYLIPGIVIALAFLARIDYFLAGLLGSDWMIPIGIRAGIIYTCLLGGWFIWAGQRALLRTKLLGRLRDAFIYSGLEANKKLPAFIEDVSIDQHVRKMKLFTNGNPLKEFLKNRENLEGHLNISIVRMYEEPNDKTRISIVYAMRDLEPLVHLEDPTAYVDGEVPIGHTFEGELHVNLRDVGHILVAGQTGGGKSNFLKVATSTLVLNNPDADVYFLDFKGGMELADLMNNLGQSRPNFQFKAGPAACIESLSQIGKRIETRLKDIANAGASTFDDYLKKRVVVQPTDGGANRSEPEKRTFIVVDEIAQLYARDPGVNKDTLHEARAAINRIARQGRAAAVHLIVATQKPDSVSFDQTVKSNLPAVLCFPMVSQAASISALGTKRAFDLNPDIRGRAVWKFGPRVTEVQTYAFV
jgi:energy-coupling factor transporter ATP-binding protein EcfA2